MEKDLPKLQQVIDSGVIGKKKEDWLAIGITVCTILTNEIEGLEWMTLIDGNREVPVLQYKDGKLIAKTALKQCKYANRKWSK